MDYFTFSADHGARGINVENAINTRRIDQLAAVMIRDTIDSRSRPMHIITEQNAGHFANINHSQFHFSGFSVARVFGERCVASEKYSGRSENRWCEVPTRMEVQSESVPKNSNRFLNAGDLQLNANDGNKSNVA